MQGANVMNAVERSYQNIKNNYRMSVGKFTLLFQPNAACFFYRCRKSLFSISLITRAFTHRSSFIQFDMYARTNACMFLKTLPPPIEIPFGETIQFVISISKTSARACHRYTADEFRVFFQLQANVFPRNLAELFSKGGLIAAMRGCSTFIADSCS